MEPIMQVYMPKERYFRSEATFRETEQTRKRGERIIRRELAIALAERILEETAFSEGYPISPTMNLKRIGLGVYIFTGDQLAQLMAKLEANALSRRPHELR